MTSSCPRQLRRRALPMAQRALALALCLVMTSLLLAAMPDTASAAVECDQHVMDERRVTLTAPNGKLLRLQDNNSIIASGSDSGDSRTWFRILGADADISQGGSILDGRRVRIKAWNDAYLPASNNPVQATLRSATEDTALQIFRAGEPSRIVCSGDRVSFDAVNTANRSYTISAGGALEVGRDTEPASAAWLFAVRILDPDHSPPGKKDYAPDGPDDFAPPGDEDHAPAGDADYRPLGPQDYAPKGTGADIPPGPSRPDEGGWYQRCEYNGRQLGLFQDPPTNLQAAWTCVEANPGADAIPQRVRWKEAGSERVQVRGTLPDERTAVDDQFWEDWDEVRTGYILDLAVGAGIANFEVDPLRPLTAAAPFPKDDNGRPLPGLHLQLDDGAAFTFTDDQLDAAARISESGEEAPIGDFVIPPKGDVVRDDNVLIYRAPAIIAGPPVNPAAWVIRYKLFTGRLPGRKGFVGDCTISYGTLGTTLTGAAVPTGWGYFQDGIDIRNLRRVPFQETELAKYARLDAISAAQVARNRSLSRNVVGTLVVIAGLGVQNCQWTPEP